MSRSRIVLVPLIVLASLAPLSSGGDEAIEPRPQGLELLVPTPGDIPAVEPSPETIVAEGEPDEPDEPRPAPVSIALSEPVPAFEPPPTFYRPALARAKELDAKPRPDEGAYPCGSAPRGAPAGGPFAVRGHTFSAAWIERTLHGVIANECHSKTYRDILPLDGGTVGICHFASGSLQTLYGEMNAERYFGKPRGQIPDRPYSLDWWRDGMRRFLSSSEARAAQQRAWRAFISPALGMALDHGWASERELAIAASVANSLGAYGFQHLADQDRWRPEEILLSYARLSAHKERRRQRLNQKFPPAAEPTAVARRD